MGAVATAEVGEGRAEGLRAAARESARRFKASWFDLAKYLVRVRDEECWQDWGYPSFEAYCSKELRIKRATAQKLVASYGFLARHEAERIAAPPKHVPPVEVIEVLSRAEERGQLDGEAYAELRDTLWDEEARPQAIRKELARRFPEPEPPPPPADLELRRFAVQARKLARDLAASEKIPRQVARRAAELADEVEELWEKGKS